MFRRLHAHVPFEDTYEVVWPSDCAGKWLQLSHHDSWDPLKHSGGWYGPRRDIVSPVYRNDSGLAYVPQSLRPKSVYAYVVVLWGGDFGLVTGAMVLAGALQRTGSPKDFSIRKSFQLNCKIFWQGLGNWYQLITSKHIEVCFIQESILVSILFLRNSMFCLWWITKKVLMLDIDLTVISCPDVLFDLPPPAAMGRSASGAEHGTKLNLRGFCCRRV